MIGAAALAAAQDVKQLAKRPTPSFGGKGGVSSTQLWRFKSIVYSPKPPDKNSATGGNETRAENAAGGGCKDQGTVGVGKEVRERGRGTGLVPFGPNSFRYLPNRRNSCSCSHLLILGHCFASEKYSKYTNVPDPHFSSISGKMRRREGKGGVFLPASHPYLKTLTFGVLSVRGWRGGGWLAGCYVTARSPRPQPPGTDTCPCPAPPPQPRRREGRLLGLPRPLPRLPSPSSAQLQVSKSWEPWTLQTQAPPSPSWIQDVKGLQS